MKPTISTAEAIIDEMKSMADEGQARHLMRFFKTGKGEYGEGDRFLGIKVPKTRSIVKDYRKGIELEDVDELIESEYHEIRLAGFLLLVEIYQRAMKRKDAERQREIVMHYLSVLDRGNNWDLVDLVSYKLLGDWLADNPDEREVLYSLAEMDGFLWRQRVAMVSTMALIKNGEYDDTFRIAEKLLNHPHDLIHKAAGWMLREVGKRGGREELEEFLDRHAAAMPRTMLRYAIEHFPPKERQCYMANKQHFGKKDDEL